MENLLDIQRLTTVFRTGDGEIAAVKDVSLRVAKGEILGIVGESGCGKSVMSLSVMGLLPRTNSRIREGRIFFDGMDLTRLGPKAYRDIRGKDISMIFQEPMTSLNPVFTIEDQVREVLRNHDRSLSKKACRARVAALLDKVGIPGPANVMKQYPHQLSGGMRQRVMIAMAIANTSKLLIADEPTTALDVTIQAQILDLMMQLAEEKSLTILLITHDLGVVAEMCRRVVVMYCGRFVEDADRDTFYTGPRHPYSQGLLRCVPRVGMARKSLAYIPGNVLHPNDDRGGCSFASRCARAEERCTREIPPLFDLGRGHLCRCWLLEGGKTE
jgi:oligopeptide/dipeptide ABC transporter ATP-binding protein